MEFRKEDMICVRVQDRVSDKVGCTICTNRFEFVHSEEYIGANTK